MSFRTKLLIGFGLLLGILIFCGWNLNFVLRRSGQSSKEMMHSKEVLESLEKIQSAIIDIESGMQGFVITSNKEYLTQFHSGVVRIDSLKKSLRTIVLDNIQQNINLDTLDDLIRTEIDVSNSIVQRTRTNGFEAGVAMLHSSADRRTILQIKSQIKLMEDIEDKKFLSQQQLKEESDSRTVLFFVAILTLSLLCSILLFISIKRFRQYRFEVTSEFEKQLKAQTEILVSTNKEMKDEVEERKRIQDITLTSEAKYRHILDSMVESCQIVGFDRRYIYLNNAAVKQSGKTQEELLGQSILDIYSDGEHSLMIEKLRKCIDERTPQFMECFPLLPDGTNGCFDIKMQPIAEGVFILCIDISKRKKVEEELRKSTSMLTETGKLANVGGWEIDISTMSMLCSLQFYRIYEVDPSFNLDMESTVNFFETEAQLVLKEAIDRCIEIGEPWDLELPLITAKGKHIWLHTRGQAEFRDGKCVRIYGAIQDTTERKKAEENIKKSEEQFRLISENVADMNCVLDL
ncbi:MAG: CHASE3 domain-containing protein, partial [Ignavibacteriae bacterium]|nr:CHASE3 domain-containing protein [Ignavibacteriota bacterium]